MKIIHAKGNFFKISIATSIPFMLLRRTIKPDVAPGEFKCRTCEVMWSSFMESNIPCTDTTIRTGLHNFDFANPILYNK